MTFAWVSLLITLKSKIVWAIVEGVAYLSQDPSSHVFMHCNPGCGEPYSNRHAFWSANHVSCPRADLVDVVVYTILQESHNKRSREECLVVVWLRVPGYDNVEAVRRTVKQENKKTTTGGGLIGYLRAWATILVCFQHCASHLGGRKPKTWLLNPLVKMGEWITGAAINVVGSVSINFGTNLLKLGHNQVTVQFF